MINTKTFLSGKILRVNAVHVFEFKKISAE